MLHSQHLRRGVFVEATVEPEDALPRRGFAVPTLRARQVHLSLYAHVRPCFALQVAATSVVVKIVRDGALDVERARVVTLDEIRVVAIRPADELREARRG